MARWPMGQIGVRYRSQKKARAPWSLAARSTITCFAFGVRPPFGPVRASSTGLFWCCPCLVVVSMLVVNAVLVLSLPGSGGHAAVDAVCFGRMCSAVSVYGVLAAPFVTPVSGVDVRETWCGRACVGVVWCCLRCDTYPPPPSSMHLSLSSDHGQDSHYLIAVAMSYCDAVKQQRSRRLTLKRVIYCGEQAFREVFGT